jgi:8-oxo-dGTP pyrophosphatase MutT (NUDIX family)
MNYAFVFLCSVQYNRNIIPLLEKKLQQPLPGEVAQYRMAPSYRPRMRKEEIIAMNPRISGVMVLLYERNSELHIVFTQRKSYDGVHSGQMSFPGGKKDETDADLTYTALRETEEEVGVKPHQIQLLGKLSELYIPPSNFLVHPSVGFAPTNIAFIPHEKEVEKVVEIPVSFFLDKQNVNLQTEIKLFNNNIVRVPAYIFGEHIIWGATAIILSEFTYLLETMGE